MKTTKINSIGLEPEKSEALSKALNELLANYQIFYQNLRGFHWNIRGKSFFELHTKFEELYTQANLSIDEIAERILTLEGRPMHTFEAYLSNATIKPAKDVINANDTVAISIDNLTTLMSMERNILQMASEANDEGTNALMSDYLRLQEKTVWMLKAYLA